jgi:hypothetical protein
MAFLLLQQMIQPVRVRRTVSCAAAEASTYLTSVPGHARLGRFAK